MAATSTSTDGITQVDLAALIALRAQAGHAQADHLRTRHAPPGAHASRWRGQGMDYAESRAYQAGDDARNIDWRVTARTGKWHTKLFEVERDRSVLLLMDTHASMHFGTRVRYKSVAAARAAAWLAWTCTRAGDRIGAAAFGAVRGAVAAHAGTRGALAVLGALAGWDAAAATASAEEPLSGALRRLQHLAPNGSEVWLFSDGWCADRDAASALALYARRSLLRVVIVADALESTPAPPGVYGFETAAGKRRIDLSDAAARTQWCDRMAAGRRQLASACDSAGVRSVLLATDVEPALAIAPLQRRQRPGYAA